MNGNMSLQAFIEEVKGELIQAVKSEEPFFIMDEVELEVSFTLDISAKGKARLVVVDFGSSSKAVQSHKVKIKLTPFIEERPTSNENTVQPVSNANTVQPASNANTVQPASNANTVQPASNANTVQPASNANTVQPASNANMARPSREITGINTNISSSRIVKPTVTPHSSKISKLTLSNPKNPKK